MRRAIAVIIGGGLLLLGGALPVGGRALAATAGTVTPAGAATPAGTRTVTYDGYEMDVPVNWPVYRLGEDAYRCVRYDVHAVYLGVPSANQKCPAGLIGRTETVSILPGVRDSVLRDPGSHELQVRPSGSPHVTVMATYGGDRALVQRVLGTLRSSRAGIARAGIARAGIARAGIARADTVPAGTASAPTTPVATADREVTPQPVLGTSWHGLPAPWPTEIVVPPQTSAAPVVVQRKLASPVLGFDTCATPSLSTLQAWRRDYAAVGIYIGGVNAACYDGNLSASWIASAAGMGYSMLPTYVGPQAPCYGNGTKIKQGQAAQQGTAAADDAAWDARQLGLPARSPIYYDMEAYRRKDSTCRSAVLAFLSAWTREINIKGFLSGVYSSMNSGISDMQASQSADDPGFTPPQAIWYARWDKQDELDDGTLSWPRSARAKQFIGPHNITVGGITMNIDTDLVGGPAIGRRATARTGGTGGRPPR